MPSQYVREFSPLQVLRAQQAALDLTQRDVLDRLRRPPLRLQVSLGTVNRILSGTQPVERAALASPDILAGLLIVLQVGDLAELGLRPEDAPVVHLILEGYRRKGLPPVPPGSGETKTTHTYPSRDLLLADQAA